MTARWVLGPGRIWVIRGDHSELVAHLETGEPVPVRAANGRVSMVYLEHVGDPREHANTIAWPTGTRAGTYRRTDLGRTPEVHERQPIGRQYRQRNLRRRAKAARTH